MRVEGEERSREDAGSREEKSGARENAEAFAVASIARLVSKIVTKGGLSRGRRVSSLCSRMIIDGGINQEMNLDLGTHLHLL